MQDTTDNATKNTAANDKAIIDALIEGIDKEKAKAIGKVKIRHWKAQVKGLATFEEADVFRNNLKKSGVEAKVKFRRYDGTFDVVSRDPLKDEEPKVKKDKVRGKPKKVREIKG